MKKLCGFTLLLLLLAHGSEIWAQSHEGHEAHAPVTTDGEGESDARDPHAYSGGYSQHKGPYADPTMPAHMHGDDDLYSAILVDRLEVAGRKDEKPVVQFEAEAWLGKTFQKLLLRTEGEVKDNRLHESENELLWTQSISPYWDLVAGLKYDAGEFAGRGYAAFGLKGLAPYWFESQATLYVGEQGIILLNAELEYDLLFTQRLILSPRLEMAAQTQSEDDHGTMSGFTKAHYGLRLRYEIWREFAPYIGIERQELMGQTAQIARASGSESGATDYVLGLRFWF